MVRKVWDHQNSFFGLTGSPAMTVMSQSPRFDASTMRSNRVERWRSSSRLSLALVSARAMRP